MLPLICTVLATAYFVIPDLLARFVLGCFLVRKTMSAPRGEELINGAMWALIPLTLAWLTRHHMFWPLPYRSEVALRTAYLGLSDDKFLSSYPNEFFNAITVAFKANLCLLSRTYALVVIGSSALGLISRDFGRMRRLVRGHRSASWALHTAVLPRISEWHLALSPILLENPHEYGIIVDVMTKNGMLYRGSVNEKTIGSDGKLQTLLLTGTDRFLHSEFIQARTKYEESPLKATLTRPVSENFWRSIPGELFCLVGSEISSINVRHVSTVASAQPNKDQELKKLLAALNVALQAHLKP